MIVLDSELDRIAADLGQRSFTVTRDAIAVTARACVNVRDDARKLATGLSHATLYPRSITYDIEFSGGQIVGEIGPDKDLPQGDLGNLLEYGSVNNAPHTHLGPAHDREVPVWLGWLGQVAGDVL